MTNEIPKPKRKYTRRKSVEKEAVREVHEGAADSEPNIPGDASQITWERPTGMTLTTNASQDTIDYARSCGWKVVEAK